MQINVLFHNLCSILFTNLLFDYGNPQMDLFAGLLDVSLSSKLTVCTHRLSHQITVHCCVMDSAIV